MAPPVNTNFLTAVELGTLPADVTQTDINDAGTNYGVYYKFTAPPGSKVIGAWGYSGHTGIPEYRAACSPYVGPAGAPVLLLDVQRYGVWVEFQVDAGTEYFLAFFPNIDTVGPEQLRIMVEVAPDDTSIPAGAILVNDDGLQYPNEPFPLGIFSVNADYTTLKFVKSVAVGEAGDMLRSGSFALEDYIADTVKLYDSTFTEYDAVSAGPSTNRPRIRTINGTGRWIIADLGNPPQIRILTEAGVFVNTWTITGVTTDLIGVAANNDETVAYYAENIIHTNDIGRWDLVNNVVMGVLATGVANYSVYDILYNDDNTIIAVYEQFLTHDVFVRRFSSAGAILNTYAIGTSVAPNESHARLAYSNDNPDSFWVMWWPAEGVTRFLEIRVSDGVVLTTRNHAAVFGGVSETEPQVYPALARFGPSTSCPFMIMPASGGDPGGLFVVTPGKRTDNDGTIDVAIPDPTFKTALLP
ncbi:MAG: hypothetical protein ABWY25_10150 [Paenisporosarcina sp.]